MKKLINRHTAIAVLWGILLFAVITRVDVSNGEAIHWITDGVVAGAITCICIGMEMTKKKERV